MAEGVVVLGSANMDVVFACPDFPRPGETILCESVVRTAGGKGLNQAIAASRAGARTVLLGAVGNDADGQELRELLVAERVEVGQMVVSKDLPTGLAYIIVDTRGENMIIVAAGANRSPNLVPLSKRLPSASIAVAQLETPIEAVDDFLVSARQSGMRTILNAAPSVAAASSLFAKCDFLVLNEHELSTFVGSRFAADETESVVEAARLIMAGREMSLVVTLGALGALVVSPRAQELVPSIPILPVDTTGAGDCFCGYFAAGLEHRLTPIAAARLAARAAAVSTTRRGAARSIPGRDELFS